ncbi:MAG: hypothetical protein NTW32_22300 [Chloroflexi bacterium]|nr:hypothetical protein [Chloroflexota bacterium]
MEIKIHISEPCQCCGGMCRVPVGMDIDANGQPYMRHKPCPVCEGGGRNGRSITIEEFAQLLELAARRGMFRLISMDCFDAICSFSALFLPHWFVLTWHALK